MIWRKDKERRKCGRQVVQKEGKRDIKKDVKEISQRINEREKEGEGMKRKACREKNRVDKIPSDEARGEMGKEIQRKK